jgi:hypothetical protein
MMHLHSIKSQNSPILFVILIGKKCHCMLLWNNVYIVQGKTEQITMSCLTHPFWVLTFKINSQQFQSIAKNQLFELVSCSHHSAQ